MDFHRGLLSAPEQRQVQEHLASCQDCLAMLEEEKSLAALLEALPEAKPRADLWPEVKASIVGRAPFASKLRAFFGAPKRALAAGLAIATLTGVMLLNNPLIQKYPPTQADRAAFALYHNMMPSSDLDDPLGDNTDSILDAIERGT